MQRPVTPIERQHRQGEQAAITPVPARHLFGGLGGTGCRHERRQQRPGRPAPPRPRPRREDRHGIPPAPHLAECRGERIAHHQGQARSPHRPAAAWPAWLAGTSRALIGAITDHISP